MAKLGKPASTSKAQQLVDDEKRREQEELRLRAKVADVDEGDEDDEDEDDTEVTDYAGTSIADYANDARGREAFDYGAKLSKDAEFQSEATAYLSATERVKYGPGLMHFILMRVYGKDVVESWPDYGTGKDDQPRSNNPQFKKLQRRKKNGDRGDVWVDWYRDLAASIEGPDLGAEIERKISMLEKSTTDKLRKAEYPDWMHTNGVRWGKVRQFSELDKYKRRRSAFHRLVLTAARLVKQFALAEGLQHCKAYYETIYESDDNKAGTPSRSTAPIVVEDTRKNAKDFKNWSIGQFLNCDIVAAIRQDGGTIDSLEDTMGRDTEGDDGEYSFSLKDMTMEDALTLLNCVGSFFDDATKSGKNNRAALVKMMGKPGDEKGDEIARTVYSAIASTKLDAVASAIAERVEVATLEKATAPKVVAAVG